MSGRWAEEKPEQSESLSGIEKATAMEEAQRVVDTLRRRSCSSQKLQAVREQEDAHKSKEKLFSSWISLRPGQKEESDFILNHQVKASDTKS